MEYVGMFIICSPTKLKIPGYKGSLLLSWKSDSKKNHIFAILLFQNVQQHSVLLKCIATLNSVFISHKRNERKNQNVKITNKSFETVTNSRHVGKALTRQICMCEECKSWLNSGRCFLSSGLESLGCTKL